MYSYRHSLVEGSMMIIKVCNKIKLLALICLAAGISSVFASDNNDGGQLSVGVGVAHKESPLSDDYDGAKLFLSGRYQWQGFFVELSTGPTSDKALPAIGYNFYNTEHWGFDLINTIPDGDITFRSRSEEEGARTRFRDRTVGAGLRALGSWGNTSLQAMALPYYNEDFQSDSLIHYASFWLDQRWQFNKWNLNGLLGAKYRSTGLMNYKWGINASDGDTFLPDYKATSGIDYTLELDLSYPLSKNIVFLSYVRGTEFSKSMMESPITKSVREFNGRPKREFELGLSISYVF